MTEHKKKIALVSTGGTIAGTGPAGTSRNYRAGALPVSSILETIPQVSKLADIHVYEICSVDSNNVGADIYAKLKKTIEKLEADPDVDGIVITHGTDTLEETAFLLNLVLDVSKPVIMTGAMRPATSLSADGPMNLVQAISLAASGKAGGMGVLCVASNTIYSGRDIIKTSSYKTDAFQENGPGFVGIMQDEQAYILRTPFRPHTKMTPFHAVDLGSLPRVEIFYVHADSDAALLKWMLENYDGVIIAGTGAGNYPDTIKEVIEEYSGPCRIVRSSRIFHSATADSEIFDPQRKAVPAMLLPPDKARILLQLALAAGVDVRTAFETY